MNEFPGCDSNRINETPITITPGGRVLGWTGYVDFVAITRHGDGWSIDCGPPRETIQGARDAVLEGCARLISHATNVSTTLKRLSAASIEAADG